MWYALNPDGLDPSYITTIVPLVVVPAVSLATAERTKGKDAFYQKLKLAT